MDHWTQNTESNPDKALRCVTIRQILRGSPSFSMLMLVANVYRQSIDAQGSRWFGFDDGLGKIDGYKRQTEGDFIFEPFAYARIVGESEHRGNRKLLKIFHIEPIYEAHEIFHHLLHTIIDTLRSEKGSPPVDHYAASNPSNLTLLKPRASQERLNHNITAFQAMSLSNVSSLRTSQDQMYNSDSEDESLLDITPHLPLSMLQTRIISSISNLQAKAGEDKGTGAHINSIVRDIHSSYPNITVLELFTAMEQLLSECLVYNTVDDEHYACHSARRQ